MARRYGLVFTTGGFAPVEPDLGSGGGGLEAASPGLDLAAGAALGFAGADGLDVGSDDAAPDAGLPAGGLDDAAEDEVLAAAADPFAGGLPGALPAGAAFAEAEGLAGGW